MRTGSDRGSSAAEFGVLLAVLAVAVLSAASVGGESLEALLTSAVAVVAG